MRECKNICLYFKTISFSFGGKIYQNGIKYCKTCNKFMELNGYRCVCCKSNVRCKSHSKKCRIDNNKIKKELEKIKSTVIKQKLEILDKITEFEERKIELYTKTKSVSDFLERC